MARLIKHHEDFTCEHCGAEVKATTSGCTRNHCPICLYSKHVDDTNPGDRASDCGGLMKPMDVVNDKKKGEMLIQVCQECGHVMRNRIADDDSRDEMIKICQRKADTMFH